MAVVKNPQKCTLQFVVKTGVTATGGPKLATRSYSTINRDTTDAVLFDIAQKLAALQKYPLSDIRRVDVNALISE